MQETPTLKLLFEDAFGLCYVHIIEDVNEDNKTKYIIHSHVKEGYDKEAIPKIREYSALVDEMFKEKGVTELYTWSTRPEEEKYAQLLGFYPTGNEISMTHPETGEPVWLGPPILEHKKEL